MASPMKSEILRNKLAPLSLCPPQDSRPDLGVGPFEPGPSKLESGDCHDRVASIFRVKHFTPTYIVNVHGFTEKKVTFLLQDESSDLKAQTTIFLRTSFTYVPHMCHICGMTFKDSVFVIMVKCHTYCNTSLYPGAKKLENTK